MSDPQRLEGISTRWSLVRRAHAAGEDRTASEARNVLVLRYAKAIRGYVGGMVKSREDADELAQDAMVRLLRGDFAGADPNRGRFRDLLKTSLRNMVRNWWAKQSRARPAEMDLNLVAGQDDDNDATWLGAWQGTVLDHVWAALKDFERGHPGNPAHTLLRLRTEFPDDTSDQLAARLSQKLGTTIRADACRQILRRARLRFAELLIAEIEAGLADPSPAQIEEELAALGLLEHVRDFLPGDWKEKGELAKE